MKVGDIVKWHSQGHDPDGSLADNGLVVQLSRTGWHSLCALVLFEDGAVEWIPTGGLEVDNESR